MHSSVSVLRGAKPHKRLLETRRGSSSRSRRSCLRDKQQVVSNTVLAKVRAAPGCGEDDVPDQRWSGDGQYVIALNLLTELGRQRT